MLANIITCSWLSHLDIGFADSSQGIINRYFDHHFPLAAEEGKQKMQALEDALKALRETVGDAAVGSLPSTV